ncbi:hypothetical protein GLYMA_16G195200v4 [Glycine max]|uniref:Uncharacterized protein n=2 Tax=Glycine subgen. Soja TaxID=1462606 RepID=C6T4Q5_SOYBN|nr:unknown [Glycine max]KAH1152027.1 hypothetical protein GYH30_045497 [Glycine max]KRH09086.1 hypothetical protein GLYMA_16G195200v4 [Glycine max]RZB61756.1 hypothetical protein D0Y65_044184 [Glycine soja]
MRNIITLYRRFFIPTLLIFVTLLAFSLIMLFIYKHYKLRKHMMYMSQINAGFHEFNTMRDPYKSYHI